ncbi:MAG TPA: ABC transporter permease [Pyrinomonadaceae bacterium]|jgi:putative ABC transport system permease protein|nr:ABC transporter permease [Pyrinomonadaceae bacterium]
MRLRPWSRRRAREAELDAELRSHLEMAVQDRVERGETLEEAEAAVRREFGNAGLIKEVTREMWGWMWLEQILQDVRYGARFLRRAPGFTSVAVLTLALGIGANTAIFSVVDAVLLRALPYRDADRLVTLWEDNRSGNHPRNVTSAANFLELQSQAKSFEEMAAFFDMRLNLTGAGEPVAVPIQVGTTNLFTVLGANAMLGRTFTAEDGEPGHGNVIVLSYGFWQRQFGGARDVIGKTVALDGANVTIIGVMPADFKWFIKENSRSGQPPELWVPTRLRQARGRYLSSVGRLKPGVTLAEAQAELNTIMSRLGQEQPEYNANMGVTLVGVREQLAGEIKTPLLVLLGAVAFVLLIACANVANLMLARAASRSKEIAIRAALGAGGGRIIRQLLTESLLLSLMGGALGVGLAMWGVAALVALSPPNLIGSEQVGVSLPVLGFTLGVSILTGVVFGLLPALEASRTDANEALKETGRGNTRSRRSRRARAAFVVVQIALALVLLVGAGLMVRSFTRLVAVDPGFDPKNLLTLRVQLPARKYKEDPKVVNFYRQATEQLASLPGVRSVSLANYLPFYTGLGARTAFTIEGQPAPAPDKRPSTDVRVTDENYFRTLGIPVLQGRTFTQQEATEDRHTIVISEALARKYFPGENPLGKRIAVTMMENPPMNEIIGVVADVKYDKLDAEAYPMVYWTLPQLTYSEMTLVVRTEGDPLALAAPARRVIQSIDPAQPVADLRTMESWVGESVARARFGTLLLTVFACIALLLASVGIYGVTAYTVTQRTHEIGIRVALGAQASDVLRLIVGHGMRLALIGVAVGVGGALLLTRVLGTLLFGVSPTDLATFISVASVLMLVTFLACYMPARRATKVDPMLALRSE